MREILVRELNAANMKVYLQHSEEFNRKVRRMLQEPTSMTTIHLPLRRQRSTLR